MFASFAGDLQNKLSQNSGDLVVSQASTTTTLTSSCQPQRLRSVGDVHSDRRRRLARSGTPTGTVNFLDGTHDRSAPARSIRSGTATFSTSTLALGTHSITAVYAGDTNFVTSTSTAVSQVVNQATTTTAAAAATATFSTSNQNVTLNATVTSPGGGTVNEGTETFTLLQGNTVIGTAVTVNVAAGAAGATYVLPGGTAGGTYTIKAVYNGTSNFAPSTDTSHSLTVSPAATTTTAAAAVATSSASDQNVTLNAAVTSPGGTVNEGAVTFTLLQGNTVIGTAITVPVTAGAASGPYVLPGNTAAGTYTIKAVYNDTGTNFVTSTDTTHSLVVS